MISLMLLIILQWNARSLIANGQEFKKYIDKLKEKPNIICVQETWLKPDIDCIIKGYTAIRRDRGKGRGGGVPTFIQNGISYKVLGVNKNHELIVTRVWTKRGPVNIVNYYNPCGKLDESILENILEPAQGNMVWCGDFNSHHLLWGSDHTDSNGYIIEEFIDSKCLVCINNGEGTRYNGSATQNQSLI